MSLLESAGFPPSRLRVVPPGRDVAKAADGPTDLALSSYTYDDLAPGETDPDQEQFSIAHDRAYILPTIRAAMAANPDIKVMALPWSPPAWMKTNDALGGGGFNTANFPALAKYFAKFIAA